MAREVTLELFRRAEVLAKELQISILMGSSPRFVGQDIVNTAMLLLPDGKKIMQDKVYLTPDEVDWGWKGGTQIKVFWRSTNPK